MGINDYTLGEIRRACSMLSDTPEMLFARVLRGDGVDAVCDILGTLHTENGGELFDGSPRGGGPAAEVRVHSLAAQTSASS